MVKFQFDPKSIHTSIEKLKSGVLSDHIEEAAYTATEYGKQESPKITGHNRRSVTVDFYKPNGTVKTKGEMGKAANEADIPKGQMGFRIYTQSGYGGFLEIGTRRMAAQPYIRKGFNRAVSELESALEGCARD
jgi:hypothetical protein